MTLDSAEESHPEGLHSWTTAETSQTHLEVPAVEQSSVSTGNKSTGPDLVSMRWGRHSFMVSRAEEMARRARLASLICFVCVDPIYNADFSTWNRWGETVVFFEEVGLAVPAHCQCLYGPPDTVQYGASPEWKGRWAEYLVVEKLRSLKFRTWTPTDAEGHVDVLACDPKGRMFRVQVRSASWDAGSNRYYCNLRVRGVRWGTMPKDVEFVFVVGFRPVVENGPEIYVFPAQVVAHRTQLHFSPDGQYASFRNAWWLLLRQNVEEALAELQKSLDFIAGHEESVLGFPDDPVICGITRGQVIEICLRHVLISTSDLYSDVPMGRENLAFFWFLRKEIERVVIHELCHAEHNLFNRFDEQGGFINPCSCEPHKFSHGPWHDDEKIVDQLSRLMVYGADYYEEIP